MNILVTDSNIRSAVYLIRKYGEMGNSVYAGDRDKFSIGFFSKYTEGRIIYPDPYESEEKFVNFLLKKAKQYKINVIFPIRTETCLALSKNKKKFEKIGIKIPITDFTKISLFANKKNAYKLLEKIKISQPRIYKSLESVKDKDFPILVKPELSSGGRGIKIFLEKKGLSVFLKKINKNFLDNLLVQEYVNGVNEYEWFALYDFSSKKIFSGQAKKIRGYPNKTGPYSLRETMFNKKIEEIGTKIAEHVKWQGPIHIDFIEDKRNKDLKLLEINPRPWASLITSEFAGVPMAELWLKMAKGEKNFKKYKFKTKVKTEWLLPADILWLISDLSIDNIRKFFKERKNAKYEFIDFKDWQSLLGFFITSVYFLINNKRRNYALR